MLSQEMQNLINDLNAPIKSFRIFALEELIKSGDSKALLDKLVQLKALETDQECLMLFEHAIGAIDARLSGTKEEQVVSADEDFLSFWEKATDAEQMAMLSNLPARIPRHLRDKGPGLLASARSYVVAARIVRGFCRRWPKEKFDLITNMVKSKSLILKLAAIRTLVHMNPELLINDLPGLLASEDPQLKALAIRALTKIDKEEALNHLQALLLSASETDRLAGIQNCLFLPFDMVKSPLIKYFAAETNPGLLTRAGWLLEMNPDVQVPYYLYEILERSDEKKAKQVRSILNNAVRLLNQSGILGDKFPEYTENLQNYVAKKNALRFTKQVVASLNIETIPQNIDARIKAGLKKSKLIQKTFEEALTWPTSELVKKHITRYLSQVDSLIESKAAQPMEEKQKQLQAGFLAEKTEEEQLKLLTELNETTAKASQNEIIKTVLDKDSSYEVKAAALGILTYYKMKGLEEQAVKFISNPNLVFATSAVEYLGAVDPERIFPYLGRCLKIADINMKSAALGILKNFDFNQALSYLNVMLYSPDPKQQHMAIQCMDEFDFGLIREQLTDFLCRCTTESLAEAGLCHFAANPSWENQYSLYKIEKAHTGNIAKQARALRESSPQVPEEVTATSEEQTVEERQENLEKIEQDLKERLKVEQEKKKAQRPAYAYKSAQSAESQRNSKAQLAAIFYIIRTKVLAQYKWVTLGVLLVCAFLFWDFFVPKSAVKQTGSTGPLAASQHVREGKVDLVEGTTIVFITTQNERFVLAPQREGYRVPREGTLLRISLIPFRKYPDGSFVARIRSMREIDAYSKEFSGGQK